LFATVARGTIVRKLDPSVGGSGPHDFAVRGNSTRQLTLPRPSHSASNVRDDREAPLFRVRNGPIEAIDLPDGTNEIFFAQELDSPNRFE